MATPQQNAPRDITNIIRYLTNTFNNATNKLDKASWGIQGPNELYLLHREFAYLLNEVMQGPPCVLQKNISLCNEFIDQCFQTSSDK